MSACSKTVGLVLVGFSCLGPAFAGEAEDIADLFRSACFESVPSFNAAEKAIASAGGRTTQSRSVCRNGGTMRFSEWRVELGQEYGAVRFFVIDAPPAARGKPSRFVCGYSIENAPDNIPGKATISALSGLWEAARPKKSSKGTVLNWTVIRAGVGLGLATSIENQKKYEFNVAFKKNLKPC